MTDIAYYNEYDKYVAEWLRNLINAGLIAPGVVDDRSIEDVRPDDLTGFTQHHFFAGLGGWSYALRAAGWADHRPVWTASCPCQPYSQAGEGRGFDDERHLWPAFHHLHSEYVKWCRRYEKRPPIVLGEQVASSYVDPWVDLVQADLEALAHTFGAVPFPSAGVGAPHIRDRLYWMADASGERWDGRQDSTGPRGRVSTKAGGAAIGLADAIVFERSGRFPGAGNEHSTGGWVEGATALAGLRDDMRVGDTERDGLRGGGRKATNIVDQSSNGTVHPAPTCAPGPTNGFWRDADWLGCRDGKWRPVEPGAFPLAHGATSRVGRLRAYGNAINVEAAKVFIQAVMHVVD